MTIRTRIQVDKDIDCLYNCIAQLEGGGGGGSVTADSITIFTNKTLSGNNNTFSDIPYNALTGAPAIPNNTIYVDKSTNQTAIAGNKEWVGINTFTKTVLYTDTYSNGQASFGSTSQGGKINFLRGDNGAVALIMGYSAITGTEGIIDSTGFGLVIRNSSSTGYVSLNATGVSGYMNVIAGNIQTARFTQAQNLILGPSTTDNSARLQVAGTIRTSGLNGLAYFTGAAHTAQTASTELIDIDFNLNRTVQFATGAKTNQRAVLIQAPTYSAVASSTITNAATVAITGAPIAGTNITITNNNALWVQGGNSRFDGTLSVGGTVTPLANSVYNLGSSSAYFSLVYAAGLFAPGTLVIQSTGAGDVSFRIGSGTSATAARVSTTNGNLILQTIGSPVTDTLEKLQVYGVSKFDAGIKYKTLSTSASTLSLTTAHTSVRFTGTTATYTLPAIIGNEGLYFVITNAGSGAITLNSNAGANDIYDSGTSVNTIAIDPGTSVRLINDSLKYTNL